MLTAELDELIGWNTDIWEELRGARLFITGGTGFVGCWLLESFARATERLGLGACAVVLTRNRSAFGKRAPHLAAHPAIHLHDGDVRSFDFPGGAFSHVIHGAAESSTGLDTRDPLCMVETLVEGTRRTLELACAGGAPKVLLLSSGAVYGRQPHDMAHMDEEYAGGPDVMEPSSSYAEGKRAAELLGALYAKRRGLKVKIARGFAFVGPYLPLDAHFAAGNFIRDGLAGKPIVVAGDGTPYRSYLYGADLAYWLWTILLRGTSCRPYNVGSERAVSIRGLAEAAAAHFGSGREVIVTRRPVEGAKAGRYVPSTARAREELHLEEHVDLAEAVRRTVAWHERRRSLR